MFTVTLTIIKFFLSRHIKSMLLTEGSVVILSGTEVPIDPTISINVNDYDLY